MKSKYSRSPLSGFTLIEILIAISIMLLAVGGGVVSYISYNERQELVNAGMDLESLLRAAQIKSRVGEKPADCVTLDGYQVSGTQGANVIQLQAVCANSTNPTYLVEQLQFAEGITLTTTIAIEYQVLNRGVTGVGQVGIQNEAGTTYSFQVSSGGAIGESQISN